MIPPLPPERRVCSTLFMRAHAVRGASARDRDTVSIAHRQGEDTRTFIMDRADWLSE